MHGSLVNALGRFMREAYKKREQNSLIYIGKNKNIGKI